MNDSRRKRISEARDLAARAKAIFEEVRDEERDAFEAMPEGLQQTENGQKSEAAAEKLDEIVDALETIDSEAEEAAS